MSEYIATDEMVLVPWDRMIRVLRRQGWAEVPAVFRPSLLTKLAMDCRWGPLTLGRFGPAGGPEFRVPISRSSEVVRDLSLRLSASLSVAAALQDLPQPPLFNDVTWIWQSASSGSRSVFQRPEDFVGVTVLIRVYGSAVFNASGPAGNQWRCDTRTGHLVLVRSGGWPAPRSHSILCHYVDLQPSGCLDMVLRTTRGGVEGRDGAPAGPSVGPDVSGGARTESYAADTPVRRMANWSTGDFAGAQTAPLRGSLCEDSSYAAAGVDVVSEDLGIG